MKKIAVQFAVFLAMVGSQVQAVDVVLLPTLPLPLGQVQLPVKMVPEFDFGDCIAKVSEGCRASGYPQCTEWSMAICRDNLPARFPSCFAAVEESCRKDGFPSCPNYALTQCRQ